jgi:hypothetical protein
LVVMEDKKFPIFIIIFFQVRRLERWLVNGFKS